MKPGVKSGSLHADAWPAAIPWILFRYGIGPYREGGSMSIKVSYQPTVSCGGGGVGRCVHGSSAMFESPTLAASIRAAVRSGWAVSDVADRPHC